MKKLILSLIGFPLAYVGTVGIIFAVIFLLEFDEVSNEQVHRLLSENNNKLELELSDAEAGIASLEKQLSQSQSDIARTIKIKDSLSMELKFRSLEVNTLEDHMGELNQEVLAVNQQKVSMKELAKTYDTMKPDEFKAILAQVDDQTLMALYKNMSSRNRKNILIALPNDRAAQITELLAGFVD